MLTTHLLTFSPLHPVHDFLAEKLGGYEVVPWSEIPAGVVTLNARVMFSVAGGAPEWRTLVEPNAYRPFEVTLPITAPLGCTMLGLSAGDRGVSIRLDGTRETVEVHEVADKKDVIRRARRRRLHSAPADWPALSTVASLHARGGLSVAVRRRESGADDDSGPDAA
jgi:regulator of nucleoside diphosphate kinase